MSFNEIQVLIGKGLRVSDIFNKLLSRITQYNITQIS